MRTTITQLCLVFVCTITAVHGYEYKYNCPCPRNLRVICDNNGDEHPNPCLFECAKEEAEAEGRSISIAHYRQCSGEQHPCTCTHRNYPVCGSDGKTYLNYCKLKCAADKSQQGLFLANEGACADAPETNPMNNIFGTRPFW